jgi:hypothetical protein
MKYESYSPELDVIVVSASSALATTSAGITAKMAGR